MLYLHCGWPRTSTTSLQAALYANGDLLAERGYLYPDRWKARAAAAQHNLKQLVDGSAGSAGRFTGFVASHADRDILFSAEGITVWMLSESRREEFLSVLRAVREAVPTRCVWTLRRADDALESLYLLVLRQGGELPPPDEYLRGWELGPLFEGMRRVADVDGVESAYVRYDRSGSHNAELLGAFGVPSPARSVVLAELERGPRLNAGLSHKQAAVIANLASLSARLGAELDRDEVRSAFAGGGFRFDGDRRCELVGGEARRAVHKQALDAARENGIDAYAEFFGEAEIPPAQSPGLDPDLVTDRDLERLLAHLEQSASTYREPVRPGRG